MFMSIRILIQRFFSAPVPILNVSFPENWQHTSSNWFKWESLPKKN